MTDLPAGSEPPQHSTEQLADLAARRRIVQKAEQTVLATRADGAPEIVLACAAAYAEVLGFLAEPHVDQGVAGALQRGARGW